VTARGRAATRRHAAGFRVLATALVALASTTPDAFADDDGYSSEDYNACLDCHENSGVLGIEETKHFDFEDPKTPAAQKQCQSCHGPSAKHMQFPMQVENVHFGKGSTASPDVQNHMCLECHANGERANWKVSPHGYEKVLCSTCHSIHQPDRIVPTQASTSAKCTEACHDDLLVGTKPSDFTHPVPLHPTSDDDFTCATCHNPHGSLESKRCLDCHEQTKADLAEQSPKARRFHTTAAQRGIECIRCHKGLAHPIKPLRELDDADLEELIGGS
jgi:nitrate/TMAO reductase-like tetraheme cytochrome c subunit